MKQQNASTQSFSPASIILNVARVLGKADSGLEFEAIQSAAFIAALFMSMDAALYLLTGLLQRLEVDRPGMLQEMIEGVASDRTSLRENTENR